MKLNFTSFFLEKGGYGKVVVFNELTYKQKVMQTCTGGGTNGRGSRNYDFLSFQIVTEVKIQKY